MTNQHPIFFSDKQLQHWNEGVGPSTQDRKLATLAYQAGADMELEACCEWLGRYTSDRLAIYFLRDARRPKPLSEADQALAVLNTAPKAGAETIVMDIDQYEVVCRAINRLKELEGLPND